MTGILPTPATPGSRWTTATTATLIGPAVTALAPDQPVVAIDPGDKRSAYVVVHPVSRRPLAFDTLPNHVLAERLRGWWGWNRAVTIEMVASYGMPVGAEVFETCVWIGRFMECAHGDVRLVYRRDVKLHHCGSARAKDSNIVQALCDRFAPGEPNKGKGRKSAPGWFYGFRADVWQAYALAVYVADSAS